MCRSSSWPTRSQPTTSDQQPALSRLAIAADARADRAERKSLLFRITAADERVAAACGRQPAGADRHRRLRRGAAESAESFRSRRSGSRRGTSASTSAGRSSTADAFARKRRRPRRIGAPSKRACAISMPIVQVEVRQRMADLKSAQARRSRRPKPACARPRKRAA